jgi:hypothetical protein
MNKKCIQKKVVGRSEETDNKGKTYVLMGRTIRSSAEQSNMTPGSNVKKVFTQTLYPRCQFTGPEKQKLCR